MRETTHSTTTTDIQALLRNLVEYKHKNGLTHKQLAEKLQTTEKASQGLCKQRLTPTKKQINTIKDLTSNLHLAIIGT